MIKEKYDGGKSLSGIGGVETGMDATEFMLLGCDTVQVCTGVMIHGYPLVQNLCAEVQEFMTQHNFESIDDFRGASLPYFTSHTKLVQLQKESQERKKKKVGLKSDEEWREMGSPRRPSPWSATRPRRSQGRACGVHENQTKAKINFLTQTLLDYYYHVGSPSF